VEDEDEDDPVPTKFGLPPEDKRIQVVPPAAKSGPAQLKQFHEAQTAAPSGRGRGRASSKPN